MVSAKKICFRVVFRIFVVVVIIFMLVSLQRKAYLNMSNSLTTTPHSWHSQKTDATTKFINITVCMERFRIMYYQNILGAELVYEFPTSESNECVRRCCAETRFKCKGFTFYRYTTGVGTCEMYGIKKYDINVRTVYATGLQHYADIFSGYVYSEPTINASYSNRIHNTNGSNTTDMKVCMRRFKVYTGKDILGRNLVSRRYTTSAYECMRNCCAEIRFECKAFTFARESQGSGQCEIYDLKTSGNDVQIVDYANFFPFQEFVSGYAIAEPSTLSYSTRIQNTNGLTTTDVTECKGRYEVFNRKTVSGKMFFVDSFFSASADECLRRCCAETRYLYKVFRFIQVYYKDHRKYDPKCDIYYLTSYDKEIKVYQIQKWIIFLEYVSGYVYSEVNGEVFYNITS